MPMFRGWFTSNPRPPVVVPRGTPLGANAPANVGTLVSAESLRTFGGLTVAISIVWGGLERALGWPHMMWLGALLSFIVGALLLYDDLTDPGRRAVPRLHMRILAAVVNTFIVFGAASTAVSTATPAPNSAPAATTANPAPN